MTARTNLLLDIGITAAFLVVSNPPMTGMAVHEWLGAALGVAIVTHVLFHWEWVAGITSRLFGGLKRGVRLNYVVDVVLFIALAAAVLSGVMISKHLLPLMGLHASPDREWRTIHHFSSDVLVFAVAVHLGLHWTWIATHLKRLVGAAPPRRAERPLSTAGSGASA